MRLAYAFPIPKLARLLSFIPVALVAAAFGPAATAGAQATQISWTDCPADAYPSPELAEKYPGLQCGTFEVPYDYSRPNGKKFTLALRKLPASGTKIGTLFTKPGGPGAPGGMPPTSVNAAIAALTLAGVKPGDEVISTPMTAEPTNTSILYCGAKVVWADVDPQSGNLNPASVESRITSRSRAIVAVHYAGYPVQLAALRRLGEDNAVAADPLFDPDQQATLALVVEMTRQVKVSDATFARARAVLGSDQKMFELVGVIAAYNMVARILVAMQLEP